MAGFQTVSRLVSDIKSAVVRQFGDESGVQLTDADIYRWVDQGQLEICRRHRLLKAVKLANLTAGVKDYTIPDDVLFVQQILVNGQGVDYRSFEEATVYILENDPNFTATGQPDMWYEWAGTYTFWPVPDSVSAGVNNLKLYYIKAPTKVTALTDALTIPDTYYTSLLKYVMSQAHEMDEDWTAAQVKSQQYDADMTQAGEDNDRINQGTYQRITIMPEDM